MKDNPITRRIAVLSSQWLDFATDERARLLCWRITDDEARMIEAFFTLELDERTAEHSDLFVTLGSAFASSDDYTVKLHDEFVARYEDERDALREEGLSADWADCEIGKDEPRIDHLIRTCRSFAEHHGLPRHLVLVLRPATCSDAVAWQDWLISHLPLLPTHLRVVVFDSSGSPVLTRLQEADSPSVVTRHAGLDMPAAYSEINLDAGQLDSPGAQFRQAFLQLGAALGAKDLPLARKLAASALAIVSSQRWFHLAVPIHAALGGALAGERQLDEARAQFLAAEQSALRG